MELPLSEFIIRTSLPGLPDVDKSSTRALKPASEGLTSDVSVYVPIKMKLKIKWHVESIAGLLIILILGLYYVVLFFLFYLINRK